MSLISDPALNRSTKTSPPKRFRPTGYLLLIGSICGAATKLFDLGLKHDEWLGTGSSASIRLLLTKISGNNLPLQWVSILFLAFLGLSLLRPFSWFPKIFHIQSWFRNVRREAEKTEIESETDLTQKKAALLEAAHQLKMRQGLPSLLTGKKEVNSNKQHPKYIDENKRDQTELCEENIRCSGWLHADQVEACLRAPKYQVALKIMPRLLDMTPEEFARRMKTYGIELPVTVVRFLFKRPELLAKPDLWQAMTGALLLDERFFEDGEVHKYSKANSVARLKRFHKQGRALVHTYVDHRGDPESLSEWDARRIRTIIKRVERSLLIDENIASGKDDV